VEDQVYKRLLVSRPIFPHGARHRVSARRCPGEAEAVDAADLRQRRLPVRRVRGPRRAAHPGVPGAHGHGPPRAGAAHLHPGALHPVPSTSSWTRHKTSLPRDQDDHHRAGEGTKIVLTGDPYQIRQPYIDFHEQRAELLCRTVQGPRHRGSRDTRQGRAEPVGGARRQPPVTGGLSDRSAARDSHELRSVHSGNRTR